MGLSSAKPNPVIQPARADVQARNGAGPSLPTPSAAEPMVIDDDDEDDRLSPPPPARIAPRAPPQSPKIRLAIGPLGSPKAKEAATKTPIVKLKLRQPVITGWQPPPEIAPPLSFKPGSSAAVPLSMAPPSLNRSSVRQAPLPVRPPAQADSSGDLSPPPPLFSLLPADRKGKGRAVPRTNPSQTTPATAHHARDTSGTDATGSEVDQLDSRVASPRISALNTRRTASASSSSRKRNAEVVSEGESEMPTPSEASPVPTPAKPARKRTKAKAPNTPLPGLGVAGPSTASGSGSGQTPGGQAGPSSAPLPQYIPPQITGAMALAMLDAVKASGDGSIPLNVAKALAEATRADMRRQREEEGRR